LINIRELYKSYIGTLPNSLSFLVELVLWYDIRALMIKWSRVRISPSSIYLIKIKYKVVWVCANFKHQFQAQFEKVCLRNFLNYILQLHVELRMQKMRGIGKKKGKRKVPFYWLLVKVNQNNTTIINFSHQPTCDLRFGCVICMVVDYRY